MSKYYILEDRYVLRGWQHAGRMLIRRPDNKHRVLKELEFQTLLLCDGKTDFESSFITDDIRGLAERIEKRGIIRICETGEELTQDQKYRFYDNRFVEEVMWSVTGLCNYRCRHCFMDAPDGSLGQISHEMATRIVDEIAACGVLKVSLTGGEPLIRPDLWEIIDRLKEHKVDISVLYTNGALLSDQTLEAFLSRGLKPQISTSFDGVGWHDWMRGIEGAEGETVAAIRRAVKYGFIVNASVCVHKGNLSVLRETADLLTELGVKKISFGQVSDTVLWRKKAEGMELSKKEYLDGLMPMIDWFYEKGMPLDLALGNLVFLKHGSRVYSIAAEPFSKVQDCSMCYLCDDARFAAYIAPDGQLLPCMPLTSVPAEQLKTFPKLSDISLKKALSSSDYLEFISRRIFQLFLVNEECRNCEFRMRCGGGCRAQAMIQGGDLMGADPGRCYLWKNGYPDLIRVRINMAASHLFIDVKNGN